MNLLDKLEKKLGKFAIENLMFYVISITGFVYILNFIYAPGNLISKLTLEPSLVAKGEVWRIFTFIFIPPSTSLIFIIFVLYFYYIIGASLENQWGSFKFNAYYFMGMIGTIIAAFISNMPVSSTYINLSLFLAFAYLFPNYEVLLFFILPIKIKYLGWINWIFIVYTIIFKPLPLKIAAITSLINYFIFFGKDIVLNIKGKKNVYKNRKRLHNNIPKDITIHRCTICGITEKDDPSMEFRYCSKCEGDHEYCMKHLKNHKHITKK